MQAASFTWGRFASHASSRAAALSSSPDSVAGGTQLSSLGRGWLLTWLGGTLCPLQTLLVGMVESCIPSQHQSGTDPTELRRVK